MLPSPHHPEFNDFYLDPENRGTITGRVLNLPDDVDREKFISYRVASIRFQDSKEHTSSVSQDGSFFIQLPPSIPMQEIWLWMGELYYTPLLFRSSIHLEVDFFHPSERKDKEPKLTLSGPDSDLCEIYINRITTKAMESLEFGTIPHDKHLSTREKKERMDSMLAALQVVDNKLLQGKNDAASNIIHNDRLTQYLSECCTLYWGKSLPKDLKERYLAHSPLTGIERFYYYFSTILESEAIVEVMNKFDCTRLEAYNHPLSVELYLKKVDGEYHSARADLMKLHLERKDPIENTILLETILKTMTTPWCIKHVQSRLDKMREEIKSISNTLAHKVANLSPKELGKNLGQLGFGADLYLSSAPTGHGLLDQLRGAFPDKFIYVDLWAVWCGPCLQQLSFGKKVHEVTTGLPIVFLYLCTESGGNQEQWQNIIASRKVPGIHLLVSEAPHTELMEILKGRGYPTYAMISPDGTILYDVPWPAELNREKMKELLKED